MSDSDSIKYRLAGATVIIISLMIAWFLLLRFDDNRGQQVSRINIPDPATVETFHVPVDNRLVNKDKADKDLTDQKLAEESPLQESAVPEPSGQSVQNNDPVVTGDSSVTEKAKPAPVVTKYTRLDEAGLPEAWVLQVASFKNKANAQKLQQVLLQDKYPAYIKSFAGSNGTIYRVLIGPKLSKERAQLLSDSIAEKYSLKSLIVKFKLGFSE